MTCVEEGLWQSAMTKTVRLGDDLCGGGPVAVIYGSDCEAEG